MKQEDKDLLLKDLCSRLPYGVKFRYKYPDNFFHESYGTSELISVRPPYHVTHSTLTGDERLRIEEDEIKPYLFPLSYMTPEQRTSYNFLSNSGHRSFTGLIDFYHKNHLDWRGLIPKGLALDATNLNIY